MRSAQEHATPAARDIGNDRGAENPGRGATPGPGGAARGVRDRNPDELIRSWQRLRSAVDVTDDNSRRGYDVRYEQAGITHERASAEAEAALAMARQYR